MDYWKKYLKARDDITDFYQVVWKESLRKTIKELANKIKEYDPKVYEELDKQLYEDKPENEEEDKSELGQLMISIFTHITPIQKKVEDPEHYKKYLDAEGELRKPTDSELYEEEQAVLFGTIPAFEDIFHTVYAALTGDALPNSTHGIHGLHEEFQKENSRIRYPKTNPYGDPNSSNRRDFDLATASREFHEFSKGVIYHMQSNRNYITHRKSQPALKLFKRAGRSTSEPFTKIPHPSNYIMLANLSMSCVYEIIELMQIWVDSNKIASEK